MKKIKLTQNKYATVDDEDYELLSKWRWYAHHKEKARKHRYWQAIRMATPEERINGKRSLVFMHRLIVDCEDSNLFVDHINGDRLDNRRKNLRVCTRSQNLLNRVGNEKRNTSGHRGVHYLPNDKLWLATINVNKKTFRRYTKTKKDAIHAWHEIVEKINETFGDRLISCSTKRCELYV